MSENGFRIRHRKRKKNFKNLALFCRNAVIVIHFLGKPFGESTPKIFSKFTVSSVLHGDSTLNKNTSPECSRDFAIV